MNISLICNIVKRYGNMCEWYKSAVMTGFTVSLEKTARRCH